MDEFYNKVIPNTVRLIEFFRNKDMPVMFVMFDADNDVCPELKPRKDETRIRKVTSGAFAGSFIDRALRGRGVSTIFFTGVDTSACVLNTVLAAHDYGYQSILVEDAMASVGGSASHETAMKLLSGRPNNLVQTTERVIADYPWQGWVEENTS